MTDEARESADVGAQTRVRVDWRTGQPMVQHDAAFWRNHEGRRLEQGLSVPQYCAANGLALSTYRHRVYGKKRASTMSPVSKPAPSQAATFVPMTASRPSPAAFVEVVLEGMTLRLGGEAAERIVAGVMARLS